MNYSLIHILLAVTWAQAVFGSETNDSSKEHSRVDMSAYAAPVEDPVGLGERLAVLDWLQSHGITAPEGASLSEIRKLYWAFRSEHEPHGDVIALHHADVRLRLLERFGISSQASDDLADLEARLDSADASERAKRASDSEAAKQSKPEVTPGTHLRNEEGKPTSPSHDRSSPSAMRAMAKRLRWAYVPQLIVDARKPNWVPWSSRKRDWLERELNASRKQSSPSLADLPQYSEFLHAAAAILAAAPDAAEESEIMRMVEQLPKEYGNNPIKARIQATCAIRKDVLGLYERSWSQIRDSDSTDYLKFDTARALATEYDTFKNSAKESALIPDLVALGLSLLKRSTGADEVEVREIAEILDEAIYDEAEWQIPVRIALLDAISHGVGDPWLDSLIRGRAHITMAWEARGGGWASSVTDAGWKGFHDHLASAASALITAQGIHPNYPEAASEMIIVAMGQSSGLEVECEWFDKAIAAQIDWYDAYHNIFEAWKPRWGGDYDMILAVGSDALMTNWFDSMVPRQFMKALFAVDSDARSLEQDPSPIWKAPAVWKNIQLQYEGYLISGFFGKKSNWLRTAYAGAAWRSGHMDVADRMLNELGPQIDIDLLRDWYAVSPDQLRKDVDSGKGSSIP